MAGTMCAVYHGKRREDALVVVKDYIGNYLSLRGGWKKMANEKRLIDAKAVRDALYDADAITMNGVAIINQFPTVDAVEVVHGRWMQARYTEAPLYICSECDKTEYKEHNYCPNCGAKMDGDGNE